MSTVRNRMEGLLAEFDEPASEQAEMNTKAVIAQLVLAMQAVGLDPSDEDQLDQFMKLLKTLATTKSQMVKTAIKQWTGAKASRALRIAKKAV